MKRNIRLITVILLCAVLTGSLLSCGNGTEYKDDVAISELTAKLKESITDGKSLIDGETYIEDNFGNPQLISELCNSYVFMYNPSSSSIDEIGVFHVKESASVATIKTEVETYLNSQVEALRSVVANYDPTEADKIEHSNILVCGNYIMCSILTADDTMKSTVAMYDMLKVAE